DGRRAVEEITDAEIGVDAGGKRQHGERKFRGQFEGLDPVAQRPRHDASKRGSPASRAPSRSIMKACKNHFNRGGRGIPAVQPEIAKANLSRLSAFASGDG